MELKWFIIHTKPRCEKRVAELLLKRGYTTYCPFNKVSSEWHDRNKTVVEPLFNSNVFVNVIEEQLAMIMKIDGVISIVHWLGKPAIIKNNEIDAIKSFLNEYDYVKLEKLDVQVNGTVEIIYGPVEIREGIIMEVSTHTIKVLLPSLGYAMLAQVHKQDIMVYNQRKDSNKKKLGTFNLNPKF